MRKTFLFFCFYVALIFPNHSQAGGDAWQAIVVSHVISGDYARVYLQNVEQNSSENECEQFLLIYNIKKLTLWEKIFQPEREDELKSVTALINKKYDLGQELTVLTLGVNTPKKPNCSFKASKVALTHPNIVGFFNEDGNLRYRF